MIRALLKTKPARWLAHLSHLMVLALLLTFISTPGQAQADWPPFRFRLLPSYDNGKILYNVRFSSEVDWAITDLTFKFPLPEGTRFVEAHAEPTTQVSFDGAEITFFTAVAYQPLREAFFTVEVTDSTRTTFATHAWIAWQGNEPGEYVTEEEVIDITLKPLNWIPPDRPRVELEAGATVVDDIITYTIYPVSVTGQRIWDLKVNLAIPEGTTFLSAEAPPKFVTGFDGREVSFSSLELEARTEAGPLRVKVSGQAVETPYVSTHAWASWKNVGRRVGQSVAFQEETRSGDIIVQPHLTQQVISDIGGDVPFPNYDLTSLALSHNGNHLDIIFHTAGEVGPAGAPLEYIVYIDQDCRADTGLVEGGLGVEFRLRYRHDRAKTYLYTQNEANEGWSEIESAGVTGTVAGSQVILMVPDNVVKPSQQFCWTAAARNRTDGFASNLPADTIPDNEGSEFSKFQLPTAVSAQIPPAGSSPDSGPTFSGVTEEF
jgi:hypothetical protein